MLLLVKLEAIEHARFRALAQITVDKEAGVKAFEEYMKVAFPYMEAAKQKDRNEYVEKLQKEVGRGPIMVTPVQTPTVKSRLKAKMASRQAPQTKEEAERLYRRMGGSIPIK